jgi:hypothetical protein
MPGGSVVAWGIDNAGQTNVPGGLSNVVALAANTEYVLALTSNGAVTGWGDYPRLPAGLTNVSAIAAGEYHCMALESGPTVVAWGANQSGEGVVPSGLTGVSGLAAGWSYSAALVNTNAAGIPAIFLLNPTWAGNNFTVSFASQNGVTYMLQYKDTLDASPWTSLTPVTGRGDAMTVTDAYATNPQRFYRVTAQ